MFGNCNHCCFCCGHPCTMLGVSLSISCKNKIQCVCVEKKKKFRVTLNYVVIDQNDFETFLWSYFKDVASFYKTILHVGKHSLRMNLFLENN